ncbi:MAG: ribosome biogenesis GTP-binding protein YsxC [Elusimicrobia bacterium CG11_big_fil_rev_8_21_14_0_20_64_6]|nr:MAG: ribosome biogenesis GTP-binding protein YsxC [Elusimicrobia bacterium CG11_big_fil_rev_8_21_14_0_20_64_6]
MAHALDAVRFLLADTDPAKLGPSLAEVAFVGRSNSGKSTMINALCRKDLARTSNTPGRTRTINVYEAAPQRRIVDLPGYGFATGPASSREGWGAMIEGYLKGSKTLVAIFVLVDAKLGPTKLDLEMLNWLQAERLPWRVIATKTDQVKSSRSFVRRREVSQSVGLMPEAMAWVSSQEGTGISELRNEVAKLIGIAGRKG